MGFGKAAKAHYEALKPIGLSFDKVVVPDLDRYRAQFPHLSGKFVRISDSVFDDAQFVVLAAPTASNAQILPLIQVRVPVLMEKPGRLRKPIPTRDNLYIGYNRRFYNLFVTLREELDQHRGGLLTIDWPEAVQTIEETAIEYRLLENSTHILDFLLQLGIKLDLGKIVLTKIGSGFRFRLKGRLNEGWDVELNLFFNIPIISKIELISDSTIVTASPMESTVIWSGVKRASTSRGQQSHIVEPAVRARFDEDLVFKPGFRKQLSAFLMESGIISEAEAEFQPAISLCTPNEGNEVYDLAAKICAALIKQLKEQNVL